ncbi:hypothetical protein NKF06_06640 [Haloferax sp. AB510]|uniref:hypothetical protein n=1 Tax=Haloferax sp. AB510 TaxID=2934172 RepID=UPI00209BE544|nr:hypothetical protein [Haloferax sp. AB510]MCO8266270.1 hypothetical protein [Haloferax sp. AB510]
MLETLTIVYVSAVTVLFFFWAYGIYAFFRDCRRTYVPKFRQMLRGWRSMRTEGGEQELDEHEKQLL